MMVQPPQAQRQGKNDNNGKDWSYGFDEDELQIYPPPPLMYIINMV